MLRSLAAWSAAAWLFVSGPASPSDCNQNGIEDALDILPTLDFPAPRSIGLGGRAVDVALGDLDGDGHMDLVAAGGPLAVALQRPDAAGRPAFPAASVYPAGSGSYSVALADLDGDGDLDLAAAAAEDQTVIVFLNRGDGTLQASGAPAGGSPQFVGAADLDADGLMDLSTANWGPSGTRAGISILHNEGEARFSAPVHHDTRGEPRCIAFADLDGDRDLDMAVADWGAFQGQSYAGQGVAVLVNDGKGRFTLAASYAAGSFVTFTDAADLDGDGDVDLVAADDAGEKGVLVLKNAGDGTFPEVTGHLDPGEPRGVIARDLDGDGVPDAAAVDYAGRLLVFRNEGGGVLETPEVVPSGAFPLFTIAAGDVDGDGDLDLVTGHDDSGKVIIFSNDGGMSFAVSGRIPMMSRSVGAIDHADFDGDGEQDLATANGHSDNVAILWNQRGEISGHLNLAAGARPVSIVAGDFDGNGLSDLAAANELSGDVTVHLSEGNGSFRASKSFAAGVLPGHLSAGDLDGDSDLDLAVSVTGTWEQAELRYRDAGVAFLLGDGKGGFERGDLLPVDGVRGVVTSDLNGDGSLDLVVGDGEGVRVFLGSGDGKFAPPVSSPLGPWSGELAAGDVDGDGDADVFVNLNAHGLAVLLNDGGALAAPIGVDSSTAATAFIARDLDGDGDVDLAALAGLAGGQLTVLMNRGGGVFDRRDAIVSQSSSGGLTAVDLDGDRRLEIVVSSSAGDSVTVYQPHQGTFRGALSLFVGPGPRGLVSFDADGDGDLDLATVKVTGQVALLRHGSSRRFEPALELEVGPDPVFLAAGDLDGDAHIDIVTVHTGKLPSDVGPVPGVPGRIEVLRGLGGGAFAGGASRPVGYLPAGAVLADLNEDGRLDLAIVDPGYFQFGDTPGAGVWVIPGREDGTLGEAVNISPGPGATSAAVLDIDGNGHLDLVTAGGPLYLILNLGNWRFLSVPAGSFANAVLAADLNGDSLEDIVYARYDQFGVTLSAPGGGFTAERRYATRPGAFTVSAADLDGDGRIDLAFGGTEVQVLSGDGQGGFGRPRPFFAGSSPSPILAVDLDGDGRPDLAVTNAGDTVSVLFNDSLPARSMDTNRNGFPDECDGAPFRRGDVNQDARADIADPIRLLGFLFIGGQEIDCLASADVDASGGLDISDAVFLLSYLYLGGPAPPAPGPGPLCGLDPAPPDPGALGCESYGGC